MAMSEILLAIGKGSIAHAGARPICFLWKEERSLLDDEILAGAGWSLDYGIDRTIKQPGGKQEIEHLRIPRLAGDPGALDLTGESLKDIRLEDKIAGHLCNASGLLPCLAGSDCAERLGVIKRA